MVFNKEEILNKVDPKLFTANNSIQSVTYSASNFSTHPHYALTIKFFQTEFYQNQFKEIKERRPLEEIRNDLFKLNSNILETQSLKEEILFDILNLLVEHFKDNYEFRYGACPWSNKDVTLERLESALNVCNEINKYKDDPETGGVKSNIWNSALMTSIWNCVYAGLYEEGFYLIETIENLINKLGDYESIHKKRPTNCVFKNVLDQGTLGRFIMSLNFAKAQLYLYLKQPQKAEECFETITQLYNGKGNHPKYKVYWHNGLNRVTEAALEVYKLNPTEENKNRAIDYYLSSTFDSNIEPTEATRERLLITYMLMTEVLKIKVA
jgi:tetratricopeptide (TPR) repeat protein